MLRSSQKPTVANDKPGTAARYRPQIPNAFFKNHQWKRSLQLNSIQPPRDWRRRRRRWPTARRFPLKRLSRLSNASSDEKQTRAIRHCPNTRRVARDARSNPRILYGLPSTNTHIHCLVEISITPFHCATCSHEARGVDPTCVASSPGPSCLCPAFAPRGCATLQQTRVADMIERLSTFSVAVLGWWSAPPCGWCSCVCQRSVTGDLSKSARLTCSSLLYLSRAT
jgi:hypothetical protein